MSRNFLQKYDVRSKLAGCSRQIPVNFLNPKKIFFNFYTVSNVSERFWYILGLIVKEHIFYLIVN